jgi:hypothetical protein
MGRLMKCRVLIVMLVNSLALVLIAPILRRDSFVDDEVG